MRQPNVTVYGSHTCADTVRAVHFLETNQTAYEFRDVDESSEYNEYIAGLNNGERVMPTIQINNKVFINPSDDQLRDAVEKAKAETEDV